MVKRDAPKEQPLNNFETNQVLHDLKNGKKICVFTDMDGNDVINLMNNGWQWTGLPLHLVKAAIKEFDDQFKEE